MGFPSVSASIVRDGLPSPFGVWAIPLPRLSSSVFPIAPFSGLSSLMGTTVVIDLVACQVVGLRDRD